VSRAAAVVIVLIWLAALGVAGLTLWRLLGGPR
jgi:hypothetical protein